MEKVNDSVHHKITTYRNNNNQSLFGFTNRSGMAQ
jgi:hypothetical protein